MGKLKTNRSAAKRFSVSKTGKVKHKKAYLRHLLSSKGRARKRHLRQPVQEGKRIGFDEGMDPALDQFQRIQADWQPDPKNPTVYVQGPRWGFARM